MQIDNKYLACMQHDSHTVVFEGRLEQSSKLVIRLTLAGIKDVQIPLQAGVQRLYSLDNCQLHYYHESIKTRR